MRSAQKEAECALIVYLATYTVAIDADTVSVNSSLPSIVSTGDPAVDAKLDTPIFNAFSTEIIPTLSSPPYGADFAAASTAIMAGVQEAITSDRPIDDITASIQQQLGQ